MISKLGRKGDIFQLPVVLVIVFIAALVGLLFLTMTFKVNQFWDSSGLLNSSAEAIHATDKMQTVAPLYTDYMVFFLFLGANLGLVISAVRTRFSPTLIFFFILILLITIFIASGLVNVYSGFANAPVTSEVSGDLILTNWVFSRYTPLTMTVIGGIIMLIMWGRQGADIVT